MTSFTNRTIIYFHLDFSLWGAVIDFFSLKTLHCGLGYVTSNIFVL